MAGTYPTREATAILSGPCDEKCEACAAREWCGDWAEDGEPRFFIESMHDELDRRQKRIDDLERAIGIVGLHSTTVRMNQAVDLVRRMAKHLKAERCNWSCIVYANKPRVSCDGCKTHKMLAEAEAMTKEDKP